MKEKIKKDKDNSLHNFLQGCERSVSRGKCQLPSKFKAKKLTKQQRILDHCGRLCFQRWPQQYLPFNMLLYNMVLSLPAQQVASTSSS